MKRFFAVWLMDIAKYVVTALVISTALTDLVSGWLFYAASLGLVSAIILFGFILFKSADKEDKKKEKENNNVEQSKN